MIDRPPTSLQRSCHSPVNRSVLLAAALSVPVFYALLEGEFLIILVAVIAGYVIHTLLG